MSLCEVAKMMGQHGYRRMPVTENNRLGGILSAADISNLPKAAIYA